MQKDKDIILAVDYHAENTEVRWLNCHTGEERCLNIPTARAGILRLVDKALAEAAGVVQHVTENKRQLWRHQTSGRSSTG